MFKKRKKSLAGIPRVAAIALLLLVAGFASAATINVRVTTDKRIYNIGDTVYWTLYAWADKGDNRGIALLSADMDDDTTDLLQLPDMNGDDFAGTAYGTPQKFVRLADPVIAATPPDLRGILVMQLPNDRRLDIGNDGRSDHILARGSYTVAQYGWHTLTPILGAANYWPDSVSLMSSAFKTTNAVPARIRVGLAADINADHCVNMLDYATLAAWWGAAKCDEIPYCDGADLTGDNTVDLADAAILAAQWLTCDIPQQFTLAGDINQDHHVNLLDFARVAAWWASLTCGITNAYCNSADITQDSHVNWNDAAAIAAQWLECDDLQNPACTALN